MTQAAGWLSRRHSVIIVGMLMSTLPLSTASEFQGVEGPVSTSIEAVVSVSEPKLLFSEAAAQPYAVLRERLKEHTTDLIRAEMREDTEAVSAAMLAMGRALQAILDRSCHPASPQPSDTVEQAVRALAIHLDRVDYARHQGDLRSFSRAIGKTSAMVSEMDKLLESVAEPATVAGSETFASDPAD